MQLATVYANDLQSGQDRASGLFCRTQVSTPSTSGGTSPRAKESSTRNNHRGGRISCNFTTTKVTQRWELDTTATSRCNNTFVTCVNRNQLVLKKQAVVIASPHGAVVRFDQHGAGTGAAREPQMHACVVVLRHRKRTGSQKRSPRRRRPARAHTPGTAHTRRKRKRSQFDRCTPRRRR